MKQFFVAFTLVAIIASLCPMYINAQESPLDKVFCYRESVRDGNSVKVQILVNLKGLSKGKIVKIKEKIPAGFKGKVIEAYGSTAEATETSVNFVWNKLPEADLFIIKYELIYPSSVNENVNISGNMSYMSEFGIKYVSVVERGFMTDKDLNYAIKNITPYKAAAVVEEEEEVTTTTTTTQQPVLVQSNQTTDDAPKPKPRTDVVETKTEVKPVAETKTEVKPVETKTEVKPVKTEEKPVVETKTEVKPVETKTEVQPVKTEEKPVVETKTEVKPVETKTEVTPVKTEVKPVAETKTEEKPVSNNTTVSNSTGVFYSVQVGASSDKLASSYFDKYSFDRAVEENLENGMYKYLLGRFTTLKDANAYLAKVKTKGVACFVVAYMDGKRCTVKDALDVSGK